MTLPAFILLLNALVAAAAVLAFLYTAAARFGRAIAVHDLRVESHALRLEQLRKIAEMRGEVIIAHPVQESADAKGDAMPRLQAEEPMVVQPVGKAA